MDHFAINNSFFFVINSAKLQKFSRAIKKRSLLFSDALKTFWTLLVQVILENLEFLCICVYVIFEAIRIIKFPRNLPNPLLFFNKAENIILGSCYPLQVLEADLLLGLRIVYRSCFEYSLVVIFNFRLRREGIFLIEVPKCVI